MPLRIVYVHGWGLDASLWTPIRQELGVMDDFAVDLGFTGTVRERVPFPDTPYVAVGHSMGLAWLLTHCAEHPWRALVAINGFSRFSRADDFVCGWRPGILARMISALETEPETVYMDFMKRAGHPAPDPTSLDIPRLKAALAFLVSADGREALRDYRGPVLALSGEADKIATPDMTSASFRTAEHHRHPGGNHMLPLSAPRWCVERIAGFLGSNAR